RGFHPGRPHNEFCREKSSVCEPHASSSNLFDACRSMHLDAEFLQDFHCLVGESFGQRWQNAISCLDQVDCKVLCRVDVIISVGGKLTRGGAQLGRELGSGSTRTNDCQVQLLGFEQFEFPLGTKEGIEQPLMQSFGLVRAVQHDRMLANTGSAEVVTKAADS